jgi:hypothetical protein
MSLMLIIFDWSGISSAWSRFGLSGLVQALVMGAGDVVGMNDRFQYNAPPTPSHGFASPNTRTSSPSR